MRVNPELIVRILTLIALTSLLFSAGLRLEWSAIIGSLRRNSLGWVLPLNFILAPVIGLMLIRVLQVPESAAVGILILAAAPFAPVVPTFARLAQADQPLAVALTGVFPILSAFITPVACGLTLKRLPVTGELKFDSVAILIELSSTITLPLVLGVTFHRYWPRIGTMIKKPIQVLAEGAGAISLGFVTITQLGRISSTESETLLAMTILSEVCFVLGFVLSGPGPGSRFVVGIGTANRNIALAVLIAVESFPGTPILASVVANGLLLILLGLAHVALWRLLTLLWPPLLSRAP